MAHAQLIDSLRRLRDAAAPTPGELTALRDRIRDTSLASGLPVDDLFTDDPRGDAEALLAVLGEGVLAGLVDGGPGRDGSMLREAVAAEAVPGPGDPGLADGVLGALFGDAGVAGALRAEAGPLPEVAGTVDPEAAPLAEAARHEAGTSPELAASQDPAAVPVSPAVTHAAGIPPEVAASHDPAALPVAPALAHEAGGGPEVALAHDPGALPVPEAVSHAAGAPPEVALAHDPAALPVAEAVSHAAGVPPELGRSHDPAALPVAEAVSHAAGDTPEVALSHDPAAVPVAEAVRAAAGRAPEVSADVMAALGDAVPSVAEAVRAAAGVASVADAVDDALGIVQPLPEGWLAGLLDRELSDAQHIRAAEQVASSPRLSRQLTGLADVGREVREGVSLEAGAAPFLWPEVALAIGVTEPEEVPGWDGTILAEAVQATAGAVDVVDAVTEAIRRETALARPVRDDLTVAPALPEPVNANVFWTTAALGLAAAMLLMVGTRFVAQQAEPEFVARPLEMASVGEVNVDEISYGPDASVFVQVPSGEDTPLIIWVDEGERL